MSNAQTLVSMSPELLKVVERAQREPEGRFDSLAHLVDVSALERAYHRMRKDAAVGVDGASKEQYGQDLERNLRDLHARMKAKRARGGRLPRATRQRAPRSDKPRSVRSLRGRTGDRPCAGDSSGFAAAPAATGP